MSAAVDRSACRPWCGLQYGNKRVPHPHSVGGCDVGLFIASPWRAPINLDQPAWCSARCRDLRLPPVASTSIEAEYWEHVEVVGRQASPVNVSPQPGDVWEYTHRELRGERRQIAEVVKDRIRFVGGREKAESLHWFISVSPRLIWRSGAPSYFAPTPPPSPAPSTPDAAPVSPPAVAPSGTRSRPAGIKCARCLCTSERGDQHTPSCPVMREQGPSAVAAAPGRDTFADLVDEWDLLPEAGR